MVQQIPELQEEEMKAGGDISFSNIPGVQSSHYVLRPEDEKAWIACWQLKVDRWGEVYGVPHRLPKGQFTHYMKKTRPEDGGPRFTLKEPPNVLSEAQFRCFVGECRKRTRSRALLVQHVEARHPVSASQHKPFLDELREAIRQDNPRLAQLVSDMAKVADQPIEAVPSAVRQDASHPNGYACDSCDWKPKADAKNPRFALSQHQRSHGG